MCVMHHSIHPAARCVPVGTSRPPSGRRWRAPLLAALVLGVCALGHAVAATAPRFKVVDLGDLPGGLDRSEGLAIASGGGVTGRSEAGRLASSGAPLHDGFVHGAGGMVGLGGFDAALIDGRRVQGVDINATGQVLGEIRSNAIFFGNGEAAFLWQGGQVTVLPGLPGSRGNTAGGINEAGVIVGASSLPDPFSQSGNTERQAFIFQDGQTTQLPGIPGSFRSTFASDINNRNQIVGTASEANGAFRAALWENGQLTLLDGLAGERAHQALAINDQGHVVGVSDSVGRAARSFFFDGSSTTDMGTLVSGAEVFALDLNNEGLAVGIVDPFAGDGTDLRAFLWSAELGMLDLNTLSDDSGWTLTRAFGINDQGQIAAIGIRDGVTHALRLDAYTYAPAVPEPASLASLAAGLAVMGTVVRRRRDLARGGLR